MLQELHRAVPHRSSKYSRKRASVPVQEGPLPPERALRGSTHSVASWLGQQGKLFVLAAPNGGHHCISPQLVTVAHIQELCLGIRNKATGVDNVEKWLIPSASPEEIPQCLHGLLPLPPSFKGKKGLEEIESEIKLHAQLQDGNRAMGAKFRSLQSQLCTWVILPPLLSAPWLIPCSDKPDTPHPHSFPAHRGPVAWTEALLLGQRLSVPGAAEKKATAENSMFTLSLLAQGDVGWVLIKKNLKSCVQEMPCFVSEQVCL